MTVQYSTPVRNGALDSYETTIGTAPTFEIWTLAQPANCAAADTGVQLASFALPSDWMAAAASGSKAMLGTWQGTASVTGTAAHFRIKQGATCHMQGSITASGGGGDAIIDNISVVSGQPVAVTQFTITAGNP